MRRRWAAVAVGVGGTIFFLWLAVWKINFSELFGVLAKAHWGWLIPMSFIVYLDILIRAVRWRALLSRAKPGISTWELARLQAIGLAVNNVLFLRLGEVARAVLVTRRCGVPLFAALSSVVVERVFDVAALLMIFVVASSWEPGFVNPQVRLAAVGILAGAVVGLCGLVLAERWVDEGGVIEIRLRRWPRVNQFVRQLALGASVLRRPAAAAQVVVWSLLLWTVDAGLYWAGARAIGIGDMMNYPRAVLALSWAGASSALPAAPGALGAFEKVVQNIVVAFGARAEQGFAYAMVCHAVMFVLVTATGLILLYRVGLSLGTLREEMSNR